MTDKYPTNTGPEPVPCPIYAFGAVVTTGVSFSIVPDGQLDGGAWTPAVVLNGVTCFVIQPGMKPGVYRKWAQAISGPYTAVLDCGTITVV